MFFFNRYIIVLLIIGNVYSECSQIGNAKSFISKIPIGKNYNDVKKLLNANGWVGKGLELQNKFVIEECSKLPDSTFECLQMISYSPRNNEPYVASIDVYINIVSKKVVKTRLFKGGISYDNYKQVYKETPVFIDSTWYRMSDSINKRLKSGAISKLIDSAEAEKWFSDTTLKSVKRDTLLKKLFKGMSEREAMGVIAKNGWIVSGEWRSYMVECPVIDPCGDTIPMLIPKEYCYLNERKNKTSRIGIVLKSVADITWVDSIWVLPLKRNH